MNLELAAVPQDGDAYRLLIEQVIAGGGLPAVVRLLSDMLALPAAVTDEEFHPLHAFAPRGRHLSPGEATLGAEVHSAIAFDVSAEPKASTAPPTARMRGDGRSEYVLAPIVLSDGVVGYVWAVDPSGHLSDRVDLIVSNAASACALEMMRQRAIMEGEMRVRSSFLEELLSGAITSISATRRRASFLGYDLRGEHVVFILDIDDFSTYSARHGEDEGSIQRIKDRFRRHLESSVPGVWSRMLAMEHSDSIVVLAPVRKHDDRDRLRARVEMLRARVEQRLGGPGISAGVGRPYADLRKLQHSLREAEHAVRIGTAVSGPSSTSCFDDLGAYRLLFHLRDQPDLEAFCAETIGPLEAYDREHDTRLLETLARFLELQGNLSQTARALHLHRNGLLYRLGRIQEIGGCDLDNPMQRLALQLALLARPLLQRRTSPTARLTPTD